MSAKQKASHLSLFLSQEPSLRFQAIQPGLATNRNRMHRSQYTTKASPRGYVLASSSKVVAS